MLTELRRWMLVLGVAAAIAVAPSSLLALEPSSAVLEPPVAKAAKKEIAPRSAQKAGVRLAGKHYYGRGVGQPGNDACAEWLAEELKDAGFEPAFPERSTRADPLGGYYQPFEAPPDRKQPGVTVTTRNVIGILRAAEPEDAAPADEGDEAVSVVRAAADEVVLLGAHYDHLGIRAFDPEERRPPKESDVFWGADDNASGTTAALMIVRALGRLAADDVRPRRTVIVCFFSGEEVGLVGSKHYVAEPVRPLADTVAMINLDMVGRNERNVMEVYGVMSSPQLDAWHRETLEDTRLNCRYMVNDVFSRSDHWPFYQQKVPVLFLHGGLHNDYHTVRDTADQVDYRKVAAIGRHAFGILWLAATRPERAVFREIDLQGMGGKLGLEVEAITRAEAEELGRDKGAGVRVLTVFSGGLADGVLEPGDIIVSWGEFPILEDDPMGRFNGFVNMARKGDQAVIGFYRGKRKKKVGVQF